MPGDHVASLERQYFLATFVLLAVSLLLFAVIAGLISQRASTDAAGELQRAELARVTNNITARLDAIGRLVGESANIPFDNALFGEGARAEDFTRILKIEPAIRALAWYGADGAVSTKVVRAADDEPFIPRRQRVAASPYKLDDIVESVDGIPRVPMWVPTRSSSPGAVLASVDTRVLGEYLRNSELRDGQEIFVFDRGWHLVSHSLPDRPTTERIEQVMETLKGSDRPDTGNAAVLTRFSTRNPDEFFISHFREPKTGWVMLVSEPSAAILAPARKTLLLGVVLTGVSLSVGFLIALWFARRMARPIKDLNRIAERFSMGDFSEQATPSTIRRLGGLDRSVMSLASQLHDYSKSLEVKVSEKTAQLELANRHKSEFLANMSHELRTPLNAVIGFSDVLKEQYFGELNPKQLEYVKDINESGQHLLSLINDILDLSKIEAGHMDLDLTAFSVPMAIDNAMVLVRERALRHQLHLRADIAPDAEEIVADQRKFKQILINLLINAVKFSYPNGWVEVLVRRDTSGVMITVKDSGMGIALEDQTAIFEAFRQLKSSGSAKLEGTGLGLPLAKRFVELHGGQIWVASEPGKGAAFTFTLPDHRLEVVDMMPLIATRGESDRPHPSLLP
ncbi:MAG: sensor histidine kinase [Burkholderiales bacterium]|nr:sensor histidine kinase [Burkholderiales bacterium]